MSSYKKREISKCGDGARKLLTSKKKLAASLAVVTMAASSMLTASELINLNAVEGKSFSAIQISSKYRPAAPDKVIKGSYIVVLKDQYVDAQISRMAAQMSMEENTDSARSLRRQVVVNTVETMAGAYGLEVRQTYHAALSGFVTGGDKGSIKHLMSDDRVDFIEEDQMMSVSDTQNNATWGLDRIDQANLPLNSQYTYDADGSGVRAYIIDTGILSSHSNFNGRVRSGFTAINDGSGTNDCNGHGTHVAGTVGSATYGVAKNVSLYPVRVLGCNGSGSNAGVIAGVDWVARTAARPAVANMSLGGGSSSALDSAVNAAINQGITFAVAAGNSNSDACSGSPNRVPRALTIASSTSGDARSSFSSWGSCIDMFAPGSNITSTWSNGATRTISGTSMASPHVAGVAALYLQANSSASPADVEQALESAAAQNKISNVRGSPNLLVQSTFGGGGGGGGGGGSAPDPIEVSASNLRVGAGASLRYQLELGSGYSSLSFSISGGSGDADLYLLYGAAPTTSNYDCRPYLEGNNERCTYSSPASGTYFITIRGYSAASGFTLRAVAE